MSEDTRQDRAEPADAAEENATADETAGEATRFTVDPVTRVSGGGGPALRAQLDHEAGTALDS